MKIDDSFRINDEVIRTKLNDTDQITVQLIAREAGHVQLQYLGTKVSFDYF